jgi:hypothetical protein
VCNYAGVRQAEVEADDYLVEGDWVDETIPDSVTDRVSPILQGDVTGTRQSLFDWQRNALAGSPPALAAKIVSLDDLSRLVQRPRTR